MSGAVRHSAPALFPGRSASSAKLVLDPGTLGSFGLLANEAIVEVPARLFAEMAQAVSFPAKDAGLALVRAIPRDTRSSSVCATNRDSFIVRGLKVTDPETLAAMDIPDDETAAEVPRDLLAEIRTDAA